MAAAVRTASVEVPGGTIDAPGGEVLLRTTERREVGREFEDIVIRSRPDGTQVTVGDVGRVVDGFVEGIVTAHYEGQRAAKVNVFRVGEQTPLDIAATVHEYRAEHEADLPPGVHFAIWNDRSEAYEDRLDLLLKNAYLGLVLVLVCLGLFLEIRLAFWVTLGIPISFVGSLLFLPWSDASINMISLFAFILTLGMVVDDAIVVGEAIYKKLSDGLAPTRAAIAGVKEVAGPVIFAILTTCIAFSPLLFVPGTFGKFFMQIPIVVILVLLLSLVESLLILPAHLGHISRTESYLLLYAGGAFAVATLALALERTAGAAATVADFALPIYGFALFCLLFIGLIRWKGLVGLQRRFSKLVEWFIERSYVPALRAALRFRYVTIATATALLFASCGIVRGGRLETTFFPKIDADVVRAKLVMPFGTPIERTERIEERLLATSREAIAEVAPERGEAAVRGRYSVAGASGGSVGSHLANVSLFVVPSDQRGFSARELADAWRERIGEVPGAESLVFDHSTGGPGGSGINFELSHPDLDILQRAAGRLAEGLRDYAGVRDVGDGFSDGKPQLDFTLRPAARARGITESMLARQLRDAFFGAEVTRQQRGRHELRVYVRRPPEERASLAAIENFLVRTPDGGEIPLGEAAHIERGQSFTRIRRFDGRRRVNVTADVESGTNAGRVQRTARREIIPRLVAEYPGLRVRAGGQAKRQEETMDALGIGFGLALLAMVALLAVAFKSYSQPVIIISAIPFGIVGAIFGHLLLGYDLSLISFMGVVALAGVVVNDSLVLVSGINELRRGEGRSVLEAVQAGGARRFRPILLTSLTTFLGLTPMILETSVGARFLIPMAISLGFGVLFATFITLLLVPCLYLILEDVQRLLAGTATFFRRTIGGPRSASASRGGPSPPGR